MPLNPMSFFAIPENFIEMIKLLGIIVSIIGGLFAIGVTIFTKLLPWYRARCDRNSLKNGLSADLYSQAVIERSTRYYIEPDCQSLDPAGSEEPRLTLATTQKLFAFMDRALNDETQYRYIILLADTGMGKSSFVLNYYACHLRRSRRKFEIALFPLGIPDVDKRISDVKNQSNTVLFLDALDEDTLAIVDHAERLRNLLDLTRNFRKVLITCRTQFFPKDEEIPQETGIVKLGPRKAGEKAEYLFHKLYLSPFSDEQVEAYLKRCYSFFQPKRRNKMREVVRRIPNLIVRPMLLAHIDEIALTDKEVQYSFELYEEMVKAWLIREEGVFKDIKKETLYKFSEQLAVDIYLNRKQRGSERISQDEVIKLAKQCNIDIDDWKLTGRSLLNRDAVGNYKFAHRSIMEYLFIKRFISGEKYSSQTEWTDQMRTFLWEMIQFYKQKGERVPFCLNFRSSPVENFQESIMKEMLYKYDFYDKSNNDKGKGIDHFYQLQNADSQKIVVDYLSGLMWQQSGSDKFMTLKEAKDYVVQLNHDRFAGYNDWRLPTLEEAMSLVEPTKNNDDLNIKSVFDKMQLRIWTSDLFDISDAWAVSFYFGDCTPNAISSNRGFVRAVR